MVGRSVLTQQTVEESCALRLRSVSPAPSDAGCSPPRKRSLPAVLCWDTAKDLRAAADTTSVALCRWLKATMIPLESLFFEHTLRPICRCDTGLAPRARTLRNVHRAFDRLAVAIAIRCDAPCLAHSAQKPRAPVPSHLCFDARAKVERDTRFA